MNNKKINVSVRHDIVNKATEAQKLLLGSGWKDVEITVDDLIEHIKKGFAYTHKFIDGHRTRENFLNADVLIADIDDGLTLEQAVDDPFIKQYATFIHTTPNHKPERHRFRIIFALDKRMFSADAYEAMYRTLMDIIPTDPAVKSCAQPFFGFDKTRIITIGKSLPEAKIKEMINREMTISHRQSNPEIVQEIAATTTVKTRAGIVVDLTSLPANTSIHCPFGTHIDKNPSAFVKVNAYGIRGVECRSCGQSAWTAKLPAIGDSFDTFDRAVLENAGKENSHFEYQGLALYDHNLDTSIAKSYFHVTNSKHVKLKGLEPGIHLIKSAKGTGKTHFLSEITEYLKKPETRKRYDLKDSRTVLIGHRQSLIKESAEKIGLECYLDTSEYDTNIIHNYLDGKIIKSRSQKPQHYAICLDSLSSRVKPHYEQYSVVIIDESEQVFSHLLSDHMKRPTENFAILARLISQAKFVFCLDADIDQITMTGIISCLSYSKTVDTSRSGLISEFHVKDVYCHLNLYKQPERVIEVFTGKNQLHDDLLTSLTSGRRCFVTSNSKKLVEGLYQSFTGAFPEKKFKLVTSESGSDPEIRSFIKNIREEILQHDAIFSSPTIGTGIDITFPDNAKLIDVVYGFFEANVNTHFDIDQQLARVRHPKAVRVWINPSKYRYKTDKWTICRELLMGDDPKGVHYFLDQEGFHASQGKHPYMDLVAEVISTRRKSMNRLKTNFINYKRNSGWKVIEIEQDEKKSQRGSVINKASRKARQTSKIDRLMSAPVLTSELVTEIRKAKEQNSDITVLQSASYERHWIENFYDQPISEKLIEFDDDGKTREKIRLLALVIDPTIKFTNYKQIKEGPLGYIMDSKKVIKLDDFKRLVFLRELFASAGIYDFTTFNFKLDAIYDKNSMSDFVSLLVTHRERYTQLFGKEVNQHISERATNQFNSILKLVGLFHTLAKRNRGKGSGPSKYQVDKNRFNYLMEIIQRRQIRIDESEVTRKQKQLEQEPEFPHDNGLLGTP
jgi:hypothetical protein